METTTSVGGFNCAFLVSHWKKRGPAAISDLEDVWRNYLTESSSKSEYGVFRVRLLDPRDWLDPRAYFPNPFKPLARLAGDSVHLANEALQRTYMFASGRDGAVLERAIETLNLNTFIDRTPLERTIKRWIDFAAIREAADSRQLRVAATNWATGEVKIFRNHEMTDKLGPRAILASTAIPGIFPQTKVGSQPFLDGGVVLNTPLEPAIEAGANVIHVIYLSADVKKLPLSQMENTMTTVLRQQYISWARACHFDIESVRSSNRKTELIHELGDALTDEQKTDLLHVCPTARKEPRSYERVRPLTIHRYHPHESLGGMLSMLDFSRDSIEERIERGFSDASNYDPVENKAVGALDPEMEHKIEADMVHNLRTH